MYAINDEQISICDTILQHLKDSIVGKNSLIVSSELNLDPRKVQELILYLCEQGLTARSHSNHVFITAKGRAILSNGGLKAEKERFVKKQKEDEDQKQKQNQLLTKQLKDIENRIATIEEQKKFWETSSRKNKQQIIDAPEKLRIWNMSLTLKSWNLVISLIAIFLSILSLIKDCN